MKRIDTATKETDKFGTGKHGFKSAVAPGDVPTDLNASWFDHAQEELANVVERKGGTLASTSYSQVSETLQVDEEIAALTEPGAFNDLFSGDTVYDITVLSKSSAETQMIACGQNAKISKTVNNSYGRSWSAETKAGAYAGTFTRAMYNGITDKTYLIGTAGEIEYETYLSSTWNNVAAAGGFAGTWLDMCVATAGGAMVMVGGTSGEAAPAIQTCDGAGGAMTSRTVPAGVRALQRVHAANGVVIAVGDGAAGIPKIIRSTDDGATWSDVTPGGGQSELVKGVAYSTTLAMWFAVSDGNVFVSSDNGAAWTIALADTSPLHDTYGVIATSAAVYVYTSLGVYVTRDGSTFMCLPTPEGAGYNVSTVRQLTVTRAATAPATYGWEAVAKSHRAFFWFGALGYARSRWML